MCEGIHLLDVVALTEDMPEEVLRRGESGTVVQLLAPGVFEVGFSDDDGQTYAMIAAKAEQLKVLQRVPMG